MNKIRIYKTLTASLLLVLYIFILTPVGFWHHHGKNELTQKTNQSKTLLTEKSADCSICSTHFVAYHYYPETFIEFLFINHVKGVSIPFTLQNYSFTLFGISNKGPPVV
jgi:hypothetical protein